jgi:WD40 repeat protein
LSSDGTLLAFSAKSGDIEVLETRNWARRFQSPLRGSGNFAFSSDGRQLLVQEAYFTKEWHHRSRAWDLTSGKALDERLLPQLDAGFTRFSFRNASEVALGDSAGAIVLWDLTTGAAVRRFNRGAVMLGSQTVSPNRALFATGRSDGRIVVWSPDEGRPVANYAVTSHSIEYVEFSGDGKLLVSSSGGIWSMVAPPKPVSIVDALTGQQKGTVEIEGLVNVAVDSRSQEFAITHSTRVERRQLPSGRLVTTYEGHQKITLSTAYSPDGRWLASGGGDSVAVVWDVPSGNQFRVLRTDERSVTSLAFSIDSKLLASADTEKIAVWDVAQGTRLATLRGHSGWVNTVAFSPDGRQLVSGGWDHTVRI